MEKRTPNIELFTDIVKCCLDPHVDIVYQLRVNARTNSDAAVFADLNLLSQDRWNALISLADSASDESIYFVLVPESGDPRVFHPVEANEMLEDEWCDKSEEIRDFIDSVRNELHEFIETKASKLSIDEIHGKLREFSDTCSNRLKEILARTYADDALATKIVDFFFTELSSEEPRYANWSDPMLYMDEDEEDD